MEIDAETMDIKFSGYRFFKANNRFERMDGIYDVKDFFLNRQ